MPIDKETEDLIEKLRKKLGHMGDDERMWVFVTLMGGYCRYCGSAYLPCYCLRDD